MISSLYVHFPFCESKCSYCDFYSLGRAKVPSDSITRFKKALLKEATLQCHTLSPALETMFLGGGTPTVFSAAVTERCLAPILKKHEISNRTEWTIEANPSSVTPSRLRAFRRLGVNRLSLGIQSLDQSLLSRLGRIHTPQTALRVLSWAFDSDFENVSVDILCGIPGQSVSDLEETLRGLMKFPIKHVSCYLLTLAPNHPMRKDLPNESAQLAHLMFAQELLRSKGFEHYEISNFAKPGMRCRHNVNYWRRGSYLGLGPSAHSFDATTNRRWKNFSSLDRYARSLSGGRSPIEWSEALSPEQLELEKWMLALRTAEGFPKSWLKTHTLRDKTLLLEADGLIESHPEITGNKRLTPKGFFLSDQVIGALACSC